MDASSYHQALAALRSSKENERVEAAYQIRQLVLRAGRELGVEMQRFEENLYAELFGLVHSKVIEEKLGGVAAIEALIGAPSVDSETKGIKFANVLSNALKQQCNVQLRGGASPLFVARAAAALARFAKRGPPSSSEHVEFEVTRALEWLQHSGSRRLTACVVLSELARHTLTLFCAHFRDFFARIWPALIDPQSGDIRNAAASALGAALEIFSLRSTKSNAHYYCSIYNHAHAALKPYIAAHAKTRPPTSLPNDHPAFLDPERDRTNIRRRGRRGDEDGGWRWWPPFGGGRDATGANSRDLRLAQGGGRRREWASRTDSSRGGDGGGRGKNRGLSSPPALESCGERGLSLLQNILHRPVERPLHKDDTSLLRRRDYSPSSSRRQPRNHLGATSANARSNQHLAPKSSSAPRFSMSATPEATAHGALLVVGALLKHAERFMLPRFREACDAAITLTKHPSETIRKAVTELLPRLAQYSPDAFSRSYLHVTTQHLLQVAKRSSGGSFELCDSSYEAIGRLALAVKGHLVPYLPLIVEVVCEHGLNVTYEPAALASTSHQHSNLLAVNFDLTNAPELRGVGQRGYGGALSAAKSQPHPQTGHQRISSQMEQLDAREQRRRAVVIDCVANLVEALGDEMGTQHVDTFLDALFASGLSESLIHALHVISEVLPSRRPVVRARLLDALTSVLTMASGTTYAPPGWSRPGSRKPHLSELLADRDGHVGIGGLTPFRPPNRRSSAAEWMNGTSAGSARNGTYPRPHRRSSSHSDQLFAIEVLPEHEEIFLLTLRALGEFSMKGVCLLLLVRDCVSYYLNCPTSAPIRAAAVATCARLLLPPPKHVQDAAPSRESNTRTSNALVEQQPASSGARTLANLGRRGVAERLPTGVSSGGEHRGFHSPSVPGNMPGMKGVTLTFVEEDTKDEYRDSDEDYTDDDGVETSSIASSTDIARTVEDPTPPHEEGLDENEANLGRAPLSGISQQSDDSTFASGVAKSRTRANRRLKRRSDASSTRTDDSVDSFTSHRRYSSRHLADDASVKWDGLGTVTQGLGRRPHRSLSNVAGLLDDSLQSQTDDALPPWYYVGPSAVVVDDILRKLLKVALSDVDPTPRAAVLIALRADDRFDPHLCQAHHVEVLSLLLHDEDIEMQLAALALLGRLAAHNPAAVLSRLRHALSRALQSLRCDVFDAPAKDRAARLAAAALRAESPVVRRCVWPLAADVVASLPLGSRELGKRSLLNSSHSAGGDGMSLGAGAGRMVKHQASLHRPGQSVGDDARMLAFDVGHLSRSSRGNDELFGASRANPSLVAPNRLACSALDALAECVLVLGPQARSCVYTPRVLAPIFDSLLDRSSSRKRELALKVMGRLASSAGCVVAPYLEHPPLLPGMLAVLRENYGGNSSVGSASRGGMPWSLCREALRTLGLVGALDPHRFELVQRGAKDCRKNAARLAYIARDAANANKDLHEEGSLSAPAQPFTSSGGQSQPINIDGGKSGDNATLSGYSVPTGTVTCPKMPSRDEPPLLAPHVAALLEDDEDEPAHAAMYAQSCAIALPSLKEEPRSRKVMKRDKVGFLEATGMNAGELAIYGAMRGDDVDAYYALAHVVEDDDANPDANGERVDGLVGDRIAAQRHSRSNVARAMNPKAGGEQFYAEVAIDALVRVLRDSSLSSHHAAVTQAIAYIIQSLGKGCAAFLEDIVPHLLDVADTCEPGLRESILLQLGSLVSIVRSHVVEWLPRIFDLIIEYWRDHLRQVVPLLEEVASSVSEHVERFVPRMLPLLLASLAPPYTERSTNGQTSTQSTSARRNRSSRTTDTSRPVSLGDRGAADASIFDDEPSLHTPVAPVAPAALSETHLALVLRATMLLRDSLSEHLFILVPALLRLADALRENRFSSGDETIYQQRHRDVENVDAPRALGIFDRINGASYHLPYRGGGRIETGVSGAGLHLAKGNADFGSNATLKDFKGSPTASKLQRDLAVPALGPLWQARVIRCLYVVCGRGALVCRKELGARIARSLCTLLGRSGIDKISMEQRLAFEYFRESCGDAFFSVASQLGFDQFAPFESAAAKALALGPDGGTSNVVRRWEQAYGERAGMQRHGSMTLVRENSEDMLSDSTSVIDSQNEDELSEGAINSSVGMKLRRMASTDTRFGDADNSLRLEDAAIEEISIVTRRAGQRDAPANAFRRNRMGGGRDGRPSNVGGSYAGATSGRSASDDRRRSDLGGSGETTREGSGAVDSHTHERLHVNQPNLARAWDVSQRFTADDWNDWLRRLSLELLQESPSASLRSCATVAHAYPRLARQLFQPAFVSCWLELSEDYRVSLVKTLETAFKSNELHAVAPDALQLLLDLAEYMERDVDSLPIDIRTLSDLATKCRAYAKALYYKEVEYLAPELTRHKDAAAEALIAINRKLGLPEGAIGVRALRRQSLAGGRRLTRHRNILAERAAYRNEGATHPESLSSAPPRSTSPSATFLGSDDDEDDEIVIRASVTAAESMALTGAADATYPGEQPRGGGTNPRWGVPESWLAKLDSHEEAIELYQRRLNVDPCDVEAILGAMKSLDALGNWDRACSLLVSAWPKLQTSQQQPGQHQKLSGGRADASSTRRAHSDRLHDVVVGTGFQSFISQPDLLDFNRDPSEMLLPPYRKNRLLMKAANVGARAAWALGRWDDMETFVTAMEDDDGSKSFYRAILALKPSETGKSTDFNLVADLINDARRGLHSTFAALVAESYKRAYHTMVMVQQLSELEEIVHLRKAEHVARVESHFSKVVLQPGVVSNNQATVAEEREELIARWRRRLAACQLDVSTWQKILNVRSLVLDFSDDPETWLRFASLCRHSGQTSLSEAVLIDQLGFDPESKPAPAASWTLGEHRLRYAYAKHAWAAGKRGTAIQSVEELSDALGDLRFDVEVNRRLSAAEERELRAGISKLRARCLLRLGDWRLAKRSEDESRERGWTISAVSWPSACASDSIYRLNDTATRTNFVSSGDFEHKLTAPLYELATRLDPASYKAWHAWALANYRAVQRVWTTRQSKPTHRVPRPPPTRDENVDISHMSQDHAHLVAAADAFVRAIALGRRRWAASVQQDLLNLLNLWFRFGRQPDVEALIVAQEDEDDNAAFLSAAAAARSSSLQQPPGQTDVGAGTVGPVASTTGPTIEHASLGIGTSAGVARSTSPRPFSPPSRPYTPQSYRRRTNPKGTPLDAWLGVLPQLIARIGTVDASPTSALHRLLARLGQRHPQALVYPLALQLKSPREERCKAAEAILLALRQVAPQLVEQALLVSKELIRVAILWHEKWHEGLEAASRLYFGDKDVKAMMAILRPLHAELDAGPSTIRESSFQQAFGEDLEEASSCLSEYDRLAVRKKSLDASASTATRGLHQAGTRGRNRRGSGTRDRESPLQRDGTNSSPATLRSDSSSSDVLDMESASERLQKEMDSVLKRAWDRYYNVFRKLNKQLPQLTTLELKYVSTKLVDVRNLELAVPGTYRVDGTASRIMLFGSSVCVITSKQRPRRLSMRGSDGRDYGFLLKGHEDLRQDERAMQLFGLANALLSKDRRTCEHSHLLIQRYAVTPLSHNCGILNWVPACDTLHTLVREFRDARRIVLNAEHRAMIQHAPDYDGLTLPQKVEVFQAALGEYAGQDLSKVLWLKSAHSEQWLERRTHYTRSLATMSMVGHILGLGDRHPSNLMLDRRSGKVLHIDFGDSFEVAQHRDKFPERVPFRLTRMLVEAMEVSGVEGTFRSTCENVMHVLRDNRDSLLSMLEAFIHDPLISWRLLGGSEAELETGNSTAEHQPDERQVATTAGRSSSSSQQQRRSSPSQRNERRYSVDRSDDYILEDEGSVDEDEHSDEHAREEEDEEDDERDGRRSSGRQSWGHDEEETEDDEDDDDDDDRSVEDDDEGFDDDQSGEDDDEDTHSYVDETTSRETGGTSLRSSTRASRRRTEERSFEVRPPASRASRGARRTRSGTSEERTDIKMSRLVASNADPSTYVGSFKNSGYNQFSARERQMRENVEPEVPIEAVNEKALTVMARVEDKLSGCDFEDAGALSVVEQVDRLIQEATDVQNLCSAFIGWCPFW